ncbi:stonustoxin subunit beta-like [Centropristis striata]|uniref:stonustoxin subunit beta-like n=1 Tax=Centropristis striata TaxID=184440 RepID=UPI0027DF3E62|nr:stonustoxin subunit beta-like [Centropristis striata]
MSPHRSHVAALGRPFSLGMLYDARRDELRPGLTLWDDETLQRKITENSQHSSAFKISASDTLDSKSSLLGVEASLQASFHGGLIEVGGSAKYLNDQKKFKNQSRVTLQYKATISFKQLSIADLTLNTKQSDIIKTGMATHVVTGILYGANAFFVFDSDKLEASSVQDIQGGIKAVIKKIPSFNVEGKVDLKLSDKEKFLTQKFSCKFYGDFILKSNPANFEDAVKTYAQLPQLLGGKGENAVPLKVWLMPLKNLESGAPVLIKDISDKTSKKAVKVLEDLREIGMRCSDALGDETVESFPQIQEGLSSFQNLCNSYESHLKQIMKENLPSIRQGKEDESALKQLFKDREMSPFNQDKLSKWLDHKGKEINVIRSCVGTMKGTKIVKNQSELDREVLAPGVDHGLCFVFTSLKSADPCLDLMEKYLESPDLDTTCKKESNISNISQTKMREKAETFHHLARALENYSRFVFLVAAIANDKYTGATIYHYKEGILVSEDFTQPALPPVQDITDREDLVWYATDLTLNPNTANGYLTLSEGNKKATVGNWQTYPDHPDRFDTPTQVMCNESLNKRHYWEVEWSDGDKESVYVAVTYKGKTGSDPGVLGKNKKSWAFGKHLSSFGNEFRAWHNGQIWQSPLPPTGCCRVGVFLDWPAGTLSFYTVSSNTLSHLYTFNTTFKKPVYPAFWAYNTSNYVHLLLME